MSFEPQIKRHWTEWGAGSKELVWNELQRCYQEIERLERDFIFKTEEAKQWCKSAVVGGNIIEQNKIMREALEWYADRENWKPKTYVKPLLHDDDNNWVTINGGDCGQRARKALEDTK